MGKLCPEQRSPCAEGPESVGILRKRRRSNQVGPWQWDNMASANRNKGKHGSALAGLLKACHGVWVGFQEPFGSRGLEGF